ncbi:MAG: HigA family addiction module antitoxin, partial [Deltaproteobacteria bacterium]
MLFQGIPTHRAPTHPGEMLLEEFLKPMDLTQRQLADAIHVPYQRINELINGR